MSAKNRFWLYQPIDGHVGIGEAAFAIPLEEQRKVAAALPHGWRIVQSNNAEHSGYVFTISRLLNPRVHTPMVRYAVQLVDQCISNFNAVHLLHKRGPDGEPSCGELIGRTLYRTHLGTTVLLPARRYSKWNYQDTAGNLNEEHNELYLDLDDAQYPTTLDGMQTVQSITALKESLLQTAYPVTGMFCTQQLQRFNKEIVALYVALSLLDSVCAPIFLTQTGNIEAASELFLSHMPIDRECILRDISTFLSVKLKGAVINASRYAEPASVDEFNAMINSQSKVDQYRVYTETALLVIGLLSPLLQSVLHYFTATPRLEIFRMVDGIASNAIGKSSETLCNHVKYTLSRCDEEAEGIVSAMASEEGEDVEHAMNEFKEQTRNDPIGCFFGSTEWLGLCELISQTQELKNRNAVASDMRSIFSTQCGMLQKDQRMIEVISRYLFPNNELLARSLHALLSLGEPVREWIAPESVWTGPDSYEWWGEEQGKLPRGE